MDTTPLHNNYYFLRHLSTRLASILQRAAISECFSQSKDELVVRFETETGSFLVKASLSPSFSCLTFTENFQRARKNSVDLFEMLIGQRVMSVRQFENERSFAITLTNDLSLLFKLHGTRSNVIVTEGNGPISLFKKNLVADTKLRLDQLDRTIDWSFETFTQQVDDPARLYFTFGKIVWQYLRTEGYESAPTEQKWQMIISVRKQLDEGDFYITEIEKIPVLSLLRMGNILKHLNDPIKAVNEYYHTFTQVYTFSKEKNSLISSLHSALQSSANYLKKTSSKLKEISDDNNYRIWADLLMANLHEVKAGSEKVTLKNFYNQDLPLEIRLKKDLSPQKNAEVFYKKEKNQKIETDHLRQAIALKEKQIKEIEARLTAVQNVGDLKSIRKLKAELGADESIGSEKASLPYHEFVHNGFRIWVGRNAQSNDILTLKFGYKEDLWLHAKDVAGSHVLIKHQAGKPFPRDVIEKAAQLAAYNSKRKNESLCPVTVTPKKYVRKRKGDPPGAVIVEREDVIMVEPRL